ncbi:hypothetical protein CPB83DRAFT_895248 [Crepidotus variabilis]|uniref:Uncharacterized protein n=1 Tax=Crepidotus variabilis TaxID=179855 RepID=A0A9P6EES1_9AGAR|nr:hypothetical protein CPB83DRAFT_895248 [Crepidotus variabilis]
MWIHKPAVLLRAVSCIGAAAFFTEVQAQAPNRVVELFARQASTSPPAPSGSIIPPPVLNFVDEDILKPVVCQPVTIEWFYTGPANTISLLATNVGVSQSSLPAAMVSTGSSSGVGGSRAAIPLITVQIAKINPFLQSYTWSKVNVPSGYYILNATMASPAFTASSNVIFIQSGSDLSCLSVTSSSFPPGSSSSPTTPNTSTSASASTSANPVLVPVGSSSSSNSTMIGAIVGSCVGAVALVALIFLIWLLYRKRRFAKANGTSTGFSFASGKSAGKSFGNYPGEHRFNGLGSFDSRQALGGRESTRSAGGGSAGGAAAGGRHRHHTSSFGTSVMNTGSEEGIGMSAEKGSLHSSKSNPNIHSNPFGDGDDSITLASLPVLNNGHAYAPSPSPNPTGFSASARESLDSTTYPPTSPITSFRNSAQFGGFGGLGGAPGLTPSHSISASNTSNHQDSVPQTPDDATANSPITGTNAASINKKANRQSLGKKRKPVPAYDASSDSISPADLSRSGSQSYSHSQSQSPPSHSQFSPVAHSPPGPSPFSPSPSPIPASNHGHGPGQSQEMYLPSASPSSTNLGHYSTRNRSAQDLNANTNVAKSELARKSSFGNNLGNGMVMDTPSKPMHYLIPDMPMPQKR